MAEYLIVVEGLMADSSDAAMVVGEPDYLAAVLGVAFDEPVAGYVWCNQHGWQESDETRACHACLWSLVEVLLWAGEDDIPDGLTLD